MKVTSGVVDPGLRREVEFDLLGVYRCRIVGDYMENMFGERNLTVPGRWVLVHVHYSANASRLVMIDQPDTAAGFDSSQSGSKQGLANAPKSI